MVPVKRTRSKLAPILSEHSTVMLTHAYCSQNWLWSWILTSRPSKHTTGGNINPVSTTIRPLCITIRPLGRMAWALTLPVKVGSKVRPLNPRVVSSCLKGRTVELKGRIVVLNILIFVPWSKIQIADNPNLTHKAGRQAFTYTDKRKKRLSPFHVKVSKPFKRLPNPHMMAASCTPLRSFATQSNPPRENWPSQTSRS